MEIKMQSNDKLRTINLFCPSLSTNAPFPASEGECIDIGSIAAVFRLEPSSVKLNGHFLSRGIDLVSSVTWNSLLSFFSKKRLPIGGSDAIVVDGNLSKIALNSFDELSDVGRGRISNAANVTPSSAYSCSYISKNMKRMREDETLVSTFCKKTR